jgi:sugar phosphate isomerase/epimerase
MKSIEIFVYVLGLTVVLSCSSIKKTANNTILFAKDNLVAWCVVPFDSAERTPEERAIMLQELGFKHFAYDWRLKHLASFPDEIKALKEHGIDLQSVWLWVDTNSGKILDDANERLFTIIKQNNVKTEFWLGFGNNHFEGLSDEEKLKKAMASISYLRDRAKEAGCTISLYNHGDWFGEPVNQVRIIEKMRAKDIGIVYNFHHAHLQVKEFPELLPKMLPYLKTVNLNGMKVGGPKILTLGQGTEELAMLKTLKDSGYKGSLGIICHIETEDAKVVLERNLNGLKSLLKTMGDQKALATY